jgi:conserved domain protein
MKEVLEKLYQVCSSLNDKFNGELLDQENLVDFIEDIQSDWDSSVDQLKTGLELLESQIHSIESSESNSYTNGILETVWGLRRLEVLLDDADELLTNLNKKFLFQSGEITKEEYLDDGHLNVEVIDEEADDEGDI